jgi:hypothetical protein
MNRWVSLIRIAAVLFERVSGAGCLTTFPCSAAGHGDMTGEVFEWFWLLYWLAEWTNGYLVFFVIASA